MNDIICLVSIEGLMRVVRYNHIFKRDPLELFGNYSICILSITSSKKLTAIMYYTLKIGVYFRTN